MTANDTCTMEAVIPLLDDAATALLFDLDGTLTDSYEGITRSYVYAFEKIGYPVPSEEFLRSVVGPPLRESMGNYGREFGPDDMQITAAIEAYLERYRRIGWLENRVYPGIAELLADLAASGRRMAVATSKNEPLARQIVGHFGLSDYFDFVAGACPDGTRPTKADVIAHAIDGLGWATPSHPIVMIGDRSHDIVGAAAHGIPAIGVAWGYALPGELEKALSITGIATADLIVESVQELREELGV
ncbi:MAG: HAD hydrolase-like protein [Gordonia sp. (in: high G+C Gram-positive bacteria)]|uniref:HAD hydrolase-like protein n=1 Tax=Gordonia sp. (in: high G+C Gram-positive bacteria) TaxID=84139 RepID=UPI003C74A07B